ncbi:hypothetical protein [Methyloraptor flagellatus]|uniref:Uncharacterized protein n=1 Tax=Methyloraptor flagellatus TaxID=3162530 RepID=A0AAU7XAQ4_9HYPH
MADIVFEAIGSDIEEIANTISDMTERAYTARDNDYYHVYFSWDTEEYYAGINLIENKTYYDEIGLNFPEYKFAQFLVFSHSDEETEKFFRVLELRSDMFKKLKP